MVTLFALGFNILCFLLIFSGPFWIPVTLVFSTAICGNLAKYIQTAGASAGSQHGNDFRLGEIFYKKLKIFYRISLLVAILLFYNFSYWCFNSYFLLRRIGTIYSLFFTLVSEIIFAIYVFGHTLCLWL